MQKFKKKLQHLRVNYLLKECPCRHTILNNQKARIPKETSDTSCEYMVTKVKIK
jgi:hypothetical protein